MCVSLFDEQTLFLGRAGLCDAGVMVTASHLPADRNGFKFFTKDGGFDKPMIKELVEYAKLEAQSWHDQGILPPTSGNDAVFCSEWVSITCASNDFRKAILMRVA